MIAPSIKQCLHSQLRTARAGVVDLQPGKIRAHQERITDSRAAITLRMPITARFDIRVGNDSTFADYGLS